tara:strand:- start:18174 stop:18389 length:216 start_codon:yes stop_codon:yes gene_type:complete
VSSCEIKFSKNEISATIIKEMQEKIRRLSLPKHFSYRCILIHANKVSEAVEESQFFSDIIDFSGLLESDSQ